ncbi:MAG: transglycosylase SLT domain-containing protein, partial [Actinomycetota bacterium]
MRTRLLLVVLLLAGACSAGEATEYSGAQGTSPSPSPTTTPEPPGEPKPFAPAPNTRLARKPGVLAAQLTKVDHALKQSVREWRRSGEARPPRVVGLQALYQQRVLRLMARRNRLGNQTLRRLDGLLKRSASTIVDAHRGLRGLVQPLPANFTFPTGRAKPAATLLTHYRKAQRRFGVDWRVLAAVNYIETKFGKVKATSSAGASGPMQFMPATW